MDNVITPRIRIFFYAMSLIVLTNALSYIIDPSFPSDSFTQFWFYLNLVLDTVVIFYSALLIQQTNRFLWLFTGSVHLFEFYALIGTLLRDITF